MARLLPLVADTQSTGPDFGCHLRAVAEGDAAAFDAIFSFYAPRLKAFLLNRGLSDGAAEDLAQDTLAKVWRRAGSFDPSRGSASAWIFTIARNALIDEARASRPLRLDGDETAAPLTPADEYLALERRRLIERFLHDLSPPEAAAIRASFFDDLSHNAIVGALDVPLGTVKSRIRSALKKLRKRMAEADES